MDRFYFEQSLIDDIQLLNKIYNEYKNQEIRNNTKYMEIYNKYKNQFNNEDCKGGQQTYKKYLIIGKFYKYDEITKKITIPIFYNNDSNSVELYSYGEFPIIVTNIEMFFITTHYCNILSQCKLHRCPSAIIDWTKHYKRYGVQYKTEHEFIMHIMHTIYGHHDQNMKNECLKYYNSFDFNLIPFKNQNELDFDKKLNKIENENKKLNNFINKLETDFINLENENKKLNGQIRNNAIEIHYLKSINEQKIIKYDYQEIKNRNKQLNQEFKRVYKLISKNIGFNLVNQ